MIRTLIFSLALASVVSSCDYFGQVQEENAIARVRDNYLYLSNIQNLIPDNTTAEDSILMVNNYITRWATQQLLIGQAKINLSVGTLNQFDKLVEEYKNDLLTESYKNVIVGKQMDSTITEYEYEDYYNTNTANFKLKDFIVKIRYVQLPVDFEELKQVKQQMSKYDQKDKTSLIGQNFRFISSNFNDSIWVKKGVLLNALPILKGINEQVLKKSNFVQLQDSTDLSARMYTF